MPIPAFAKGLQGVGVVSSPQLPALMAGMVTNRFVHTIVRPSQKYVVVWVPGPTLARTPNSRLFVIAFAKIPRSLSPSLSLSLPLSFSPSLFLPSLSLSLSVSLYLSP